jgi:lipid-binding SYLF domain-containing protein
MSCITAAMQQHHSFTLVCMNDDNADIYQSMQYITAGPSITIAVTALCVNILIVKSKIFQCSLTLNASEVLLITIFK